MNKLSKSLTLATAMAMAFGSTPASATFFTDLSSILTDTTVAPPTSVDLVTDINHITGVGQTFTNTINTNNPANTTTNQILAIGANPISRYSKQGGGSVAATFNGKPIVSVFALQGISEKQVGGSVLGTFKSGSLGLFTIDNVDNFNAFNPSTWGAVSAGALVTPIASFRLTTPDNVLPGTGSTSFTLGAGSINKSSVNTTAGTDTQGNFLLVEDALTSGGIAAIPGIDWLTVTDPTNPPGSQEGLVLQSNQHITIGSGNHATIAAGLSIFDIIGRDLGGFASLGAGHFFASSICSADPGSAVACTAAQIADGTAYDIASAFLPTDPFINSADITATLGLIAAPGTIPEPSTLALLGIGLAGFGFRMRKQYH